MPPAVVHRARKCAGPDGQDGTPERADTVTHATVDAAEAAAKAYQEGANGAMYTYSAARVGAVLGHSQITGVATAAPVLGNSAKTSVAEAAPVRGNSEQTSVAQAAPVLGNPQGQVNQVDNRGVLERMADGCNVM